MADTAIALIVAGSGETSPQEVFDLLEDAYAEGYSEVGLVFPVDKGLFTKTVEHVVNWLDDPEALYPIQTEGASLTRASAKLGSTQKVSAFSDILTKEEFKDWDEVVFLVALPEDPDEPEYDVYAEMVEVAINNGLTVKNLTRGLDDVTLADPEDEAGPEVEPEPEPEPEEEPKRQRRKKAEPEEEPEAEVEEEPEDEKVEESLDALENGEAEVVSDTSRAEFLAEMVGAAYQTFEQAIIDNVPAGRRQSLALTNAEQALLWAVHEIVQTEGFETREGPLSGTEKVAKGGAPEETSEAPEKPAAKRGRPRKNFDVPQVFDEDEDEWIPRPKGRMRKGTQWRTIHAETGEVLEEGVA